MTGGEKINIKKQTGTVNLSFLKVLSLHFVLSEENEATNKDISA